MSRKQQRIFWPSLALIVLVLPAIALVASRTRKRDSFPTKDATAKPSKVEVTAQTANDKAKERVEGEIIAISPQGFEPAEITRPHKHFVLVIENRSGLAEVNLRLDRERGGRLREALVTREKLHWSDDLDLEPGRYVLSEATHPNWICHITIRPQT